MSRSTFTSIDGHANVTHPDIEFRHRDGWSIRFGIQDRQNLDRNRPHEPGSASMPTIPLYFRTVPHPSWIGTLLNEHYMLRDIKTWM